MLRKLKPLSLCLYLCLLSLTHASSIVYSTFLQNRHHFHQAPNQRSHSQRCSLARYPPQRLFTRSKELLKLRGGQLSTYNLGISALIITETIAWLKIWTELAKRELLPSTLTRKIIHSGSAPLFILHWPLFARDPSSRFVAAFIPLLQIGRLLYAGLISSPTVSATDGVPTHARNELVAAVSRTGNRQEALGGPLIYSVILFLGTLFFFRDSPISIVAISQMAAGDGLADIIGRKYGKVKWPFSKTKSIAGTLAFFVGGFLCSYLGLWWMKYTGFLQIDLAAALVPTVFISVISAIIELFPIVDDNISVPVIAAILSYFLLVVH